MHIKHVKLIEFLLETRTNNDVFLKKYFYIIDIYRDIYFLKIIFDLKSNNVIV
jgi:hypothetical protein